MRLFEIHNKIQFINVTSDGEYDSDEEFDNSDLIRQAEILIKSSGMNMLNNDNITDVAVLGDVVVGAMYSANDRDELRMSIAVSPQYRGSGIASQLFNRLDTDGISTLIAELIPPYTMEKFVISRGFVLTDQTRGFKIYKKEL